MTWDEACKAMRQALGCGSRGGIPEDKAKKYYGGIATLMVCGSDLVYELMVRGRFVNSLLHASMHPCSPCHFVVLQNAEEVKTKKGRTYLATTVPSSLTSRVPQGLVQVPVVHEPLGSAQQQGRGKRQHEGSEGEGAPKKRSRPTRATTGTVPAQSSQGQQGSEQQPQHIGKEQVAPDAVPTQQVI